MAFAETLVHHASDWIDWIDASGSLGPQRRVHDPLHLQLNEMPGDLKLVSQNGRTRLWRASQQELHVITAGRASQLQMEYPDPAAATFTLAGRVHDLQQRFNPRLFNVTAGDASGHAIELFRSPLGSRFATAGGLRGNACFEDDSPASWAILSIEVTVFEVAGEPALTKTITFRAQADRHGDFLLAMDRLPAMNKDVSPRHYNAKLSIQALLSASGAEIANPDEFVVAQLQSTTDAAVFATPIDLTVSPGTVETLTSMDQQRLVLRIP